MLTPPSWRSKSCCIRSSPLAASPSSSTSTVTPQRRMRSSMDVTQTSLKKEKKTKTTWTQKIYNGDDASVIYFPECYQRFLRTSLASRTAVLKFSAPSEAQDASSHGTTWASTPPTLSRFPSVVFCFLFFRR